MSPSRSKTAEPSEAPTSPPPLPQRKTASPLFVQPSTTPDPSPPSQTQESPFPDGSPTQDPDDLPSWSDAPVRATGPDLGESSDTPSSGSGGPKLSKAGLRVGVGIGFRQVCKVVAALLADPGEREEGLWKPDGEDVDDVAAPAASLVYRRLPDDAKSGDLIDLFALGTALVAYVAKNLNHRAEIRTLRQLQAAQGVGEEPQG